MALFSDYVQYYTGAAWVSIHGDMVGDMTCEYGISGAAPDQRIADTGVLTFTLYNATGKYTPYHASALAGWKKGAPVSVYIDGFNKFFGWIEDIKIDSGSYGRKFVTVTAVDWMDHAAEFPMPLPPVLLNVRANEVISNISTFLPKAVNGATLDVGETVFPTAYDTMDGNTKAYSEISKVVNSEMGHFYIRHKNPLPNYMIFENATRRNGNADLALIPLDPSLLGLLLKEDGDQLLLETGDGMLLDEAEQAFFDNSMLSMEVTYGQDLYNRVKLSIFPKRVDVSAQVLFTLDSPMLLVPSVIPYTFSVTYRDPTGGGDRVTGINMITPVATTDYKMYANSDGTGTDLTANLSVTVVYGVDGATYTVRNTGSASGYITLLQARGYGIYAKNPLDIVASDNTSKAENGEIELAIEQKYLNSVEDSIINSKSILAQSKTPRTVLNSVEFNANRTPMLKQAFLNLDIGDLIRVKETQSAIDGWYWIQNIHWTYKASGAVYFGYGLKEHLSLKAGSLKLAEFKSVVSFYPTSPRSAIDFSHLNRITNKNQRTVMAWVKGVEPAGASYRYWFSLHTASGGVYSALNPEVGDNSVITLDLNLASGTRSWKSSALVTPKLGQYHHIGFITDYINSVYNPMFFWNGAMSTAVPVVTTGTGMPKREDGVPLTLGNVLFFSTLEYVNQTPDLIKDVRIYDRILNGNEIAKIYADGAGVATVTDGLVFQGPVVRTQEAARFGGAYITADDKFYDNMYLAIGDPIIPSNINVTVL